MRLTLTLLSSGALCAPAFSQTQEELRPPRAEALEHTLEAWRAEHGSSWRALVDPETGHLEMLYGGNAVAPVQPSTAVESDWFALGRHWIAMTAGMHGVETHELVDERFVYLPMGMANGTDKITVRFRQRVAGLPVEGAAVNALFDVSGRLLSLHSTGAPATDHLRIAPATSGRAAVRTAIDRFEAESGVPAVDVGAPLMLFAQVERMGTREALLAYQVRIVNDEAQAGAVYTVDAASGLIVRRDEAIHYFDVFGTVRSMATPGTEADHPGNPPVQIEMPYINVTGSGQGTIQTDRDGNFNFVGVNSPIDITLEFNGTFNNVNNQAGPDYTITFPNVQPGVQNDLLMNPAPSEQLTAQANAYLHVPVLRDYIRDTTPSDSTADFQATSNPNISSSCNAFFNGSSVNYFLSSSTCNNTAFSTVVVHEMGHWLNVLYGTGNGSDGMGEGNADVFAMYVYDDPVVGSFFTKSGGFVRTGLNTRQFCGDCCGGCHGGVHDNGEVWMGAAWKVRRNLKQTLGNGLGSATADQLFMGWMNGYNQTEIKSIIEIQWLTLDDDNGDINDGTPNYVDIDDAFVEQGFPGFVLPFVSISNVTSLPDVPNDAGPYTVDADIVTQFNPPVTNPELHWRVNGGAWNDVAMSSTGGSGYTADIPSLGGNGIVEYYLTAEDGAANTGEFPAGGENAPIGFTVGTPTILTEWDFEAAGNQGWTGGVGGDTATTGQWERGDPIGTAAQPENDHTSGGGNTDCWFTGQGTQGGSIGENDVDGGLTTLRSPVLDLDGFSGVQVNYWRWDDNEKGASPNADTFRVQLSLNGGGSWTTVETVGPSGAETNGGWFQGSFVVDSLGAPTSQVQFQFIAEDAGSGSIVEAAVDDVEVTYLDDGSCPTPTNYCVTSANSVGPGALISTSGSQDVDDGTFTLNATGCPLNKWGLFIYALAQDNTPAGDGVRCVGGQVFRLPLVNTGGAGAASHLVDFNDLPNGGDIFNGDTWNFQFVYRDPPGGPAGFNFSDGVNVTFCSN